MSDRYDPQANDDAPAKSEHLSRKDAKWFVFVTVLLVLVGIPIYIIANENKNKALCSNNSKAIADALQLYAQDNDDRLPALFARSADGEPFREGNRAPETWATAISDRMPKDRSFRCPSSEPNEVARTLVFQSFAPSGEAPIDYGLYAAHETAVLSQIASPDQTILIAETDNQGARGSFDPLPYKDGNDAFVIGWDNSNEQPSRATAAVTRLAFGDVKGRDFGAATPRHKSAGIHAVTVAGERILLQPDASYTRWGTYTLTGRWRSRP